MDKSTPTQRPELFSAAPSGGGGRRILASLENSGKTHTPGGRLARMRPSYLVMLLMLLAIVSAGLASISYYGMAPVQRSQVWAPVEPYTDRAPQPAPDDVPEEVKQRAAAIVNEPLPAIGPARHRQAAPQAAPKAVPTGATAGGVAPNDQAARAAQTAASIGNPAMPVHPQLRAHSNPPARPGIQPVRPHDTQPEAPVRPAPDSDVILLAALVAHSGGQPSAMYVSRDVVERRDGDSTEVLLRRCQRLGGTEAGLCRARICNGQWLHEAACRLPLSD